MNIIKPPFAWLSKYTAIINESSLVLIAAWMRLYQFGNLPFGLTTDEARIGISASNLMHHGWWPGFSVDAAFSPLWVLLQSLAVAVFGNTIWALRLWPMLLGVVAVWATWRWARDWFGHQVGWVAAYLVAVTPWSIAISRDAVGSVLPMAVLPLSLWLYGRILKHDQLVDKVLLVALCVASLFGGPLCWLIDLGLGALAATQLASNRQPPKPTTVNIGLAAALLIGLAAFALALVQSQSALTAMASYFGWSFSLPRIPEAFGRTLLMFILHGDNNWAHNFSGEPALNPFIGLMFVLGVIMTVIHYKSKRHLLLLLLLLCLLVPAGLSIATAPNSTLAAVAVPVVCVLSAIGIAYMLMLWRATFPLNAAARSTGVTVIGLLLVLTLMQSITQYFNAWAKSAESYAAYNETAVYASRYLKTANTGPTRYIIATSQEQTIIDYLDWNQKYLALRAADVLKITSNSKGQEFVLTTSVRNEAAANLTKKFPGGILRPALSSFSQDDIYYVYETAK